MKIPLVCFVFLYVLRESYGYKSCTYTYYSSTYARYVTSYYRCSNSEYCCGIQSCCAYVYTRWYLWFVIVLICFIIFMFWWYYRYRYRPRHIVVGQSRAAAVQVTHGGPAIVADGNVNIIGVNAPQPIYSQKGAVTVMPGGTSVHYAAAYPPPVYGPVQTHHPPPPAYTSVVKTGATGTTTFVQ